jgi:hypothetical protein
MTSQDLNLGWLDWIVIKTALGPFVGYYYSAALVALGHLLNKNGG